ncbi:MAG: GAF domain-containing sensor histidine kinase [Candidatus Binatia bacterium]
MSRDDSEVSARFLRSLPREITSSLDPKVVLSSLAAGTSRILNATRCSIVRLDPERHPGRAFVFSAVDDPSIEGYALDLEDYPEIAKALREERPILVRDRPDDPVAAEIRRRHRKLPFPLSVVVPISFQEKSFGALFLRFSDPEATIPDEAVGLCQMVALGAAIALNSAREYEQQVAEVKRREHQAELLREALKLRVEALSAASHDLRAPLNAIIGYVDLLTESSYGELESEQREVLAKVTHNAHSLLQIVDTLIDHARLEEGKITPVVSRGDIARLLEDLRLTIEPLIGQRPIAIEFRTRGRLPPLETDWLKLKRILLNLLHNAVKFTERGRISLVVSAAKGQVRFEVTDSGSGIPPEDLPGIFDRFYRANPTRADGPGGLGLSIVKRYCEMLGADISVKSRVGEGTRFLVRLPVG